MSPVSVDGAAAALTRLSDAATTGNPFRLVVTDWLMPAIDGFGLASALRADPTFSTLPLIMLTSSSGVQGRNRASEAGFSAYLTKPVKQSELLDAIVAAFTPMKQAGPAPEPTRGLPSEQHRRALRALVADDNAANQRLVVAILEQHGHSVLVAPNGRDAVARATEQAFDIVLMDVQMPEMDGLEATMAIRERERGTATHVPIVAMTAHAMAGDRERCLRAGMDAYVPKPIRPDELLAAIDGLIGPSNTAAASGDVGPATPPATTRDLDRATLLASFGGNGTLLVEVIDAFLADSAGLVATIHEAIGHENGAGVAAAAHQLKGSVGLFVQKGAYDAARRLERAARDGQLNDAGSLAAELEAELASLAVKLNEVRWSFLSS